MDKENEESYIDHQKSNSDNETEENVNKQRDDIIK